jgi:hypothetical protein
MFPKLSMRQCPSFLISQFPQLKIDLNGSKFSYYPNTCFLHRYNDASSTGTIGLGVRKKEPPGLADALLILLTELPVSELQALEERDWIL